MSIEIDNMKNTGIGGRGLGAGVQPIRNPQSTIRNRKGSVLIMVVALLVLIALIATAMLSTTRNDRFASVQHQQNVQIDLLVEGAKQIALSHILNDTYGNANSQNMFRPGDAVQRDSNYSSFDGFSTVYPDAGTVAPKTEDKWLMPRTPSLLNYAVSAADGAGTVLNAGNTNPPIWAKITAPLIGNAFEAPAATLKPVRNDGNDGNLWKPFTSLRAVTAGPVVTFYPSPIIPTVFRTTGGEEYPALAMQDYNRGGAFYSYIAADTDDDGIADAMLQKLPTGPINGVTYFVGYRIVDNNSAINPNVATSSYVDFGNNGANLGVKIPNLALFPTNIGLVEMLRRNNANTGASYGGAGTLTSVGLDFFNVLNYRTGLTGNTANMVPSGVYTTTTSGKIWPLDDNGADDTSYKHLFYSNAVWAGLGVRQDDPGWATPVARFKAFDVGDAMGLAFPFGIRSTSATQSNLEAQMWASTYESLSADGSAGGVATSKFSAKTTAGLFGWYNNLFDWYRNFIPIGAVPASAGYTPARSILSPYNPTSAYGNIGSFAIPTGTLAFDLAYTYTQFNASLASAGSVTLDLKTAAPRASLNTGSFGELYRAFFSVMAENWQPDQTVPVNHLLGSPFSSMIDTSVGLTIHDPYWGMKWDRPGVVTGTFTFAIGSGTTEIHDMKMFRSSLRTVPSGGAWTNADGRIPPADMVRLRAAIAAANVKEARETDYEIDPVDIPINITNAAGQNAVSATARIYGLGPQVFFTEIYANTDTVSNAVGPANLTGYIAIEIHNPNSFDIDLKDCKLMGVNRSVSSGTYSILASTGSPPISIPLNTATSNLPAGSSLNPTVVPAKGYLVLESYSQTGATDAQHRPTSSGLPPTGPVTAAVNTNFAYVPGLSTVVFNLETLLMRPLSGARAGNVVTYQLPTGGGTLAADFAPLDSFDFTGLSVPPVAPVVNATAWHYARASDGTITSSTSHHGWHFVYPGRYNASESFNTGTITGGSSLPGPRQQGTQEAGGLSVTKGNPNPTPQIGWDPTVTGNKDPWETAPPTPGMSLGTFSTVTVTVGTTSTAVGRATYDNTFPIQLPSQDVLLVNSPNTTGAPEIFPRGKFIRNGDAIDVPFIGSYRIMAGNNYVEFNAVTMDAAMAEDTVVADDPNCNPTSYTYNPDSDNGTQYREQIGRFCPLPNTDSTSLPNDRFAIGSATIIFGDFPGYSLADDARSSPTDGQHAQWLTEMRKMSYQWTSDLFDYVGTNSGAPLDPISRQSDPVSGLVNINTAGWEVLAMVPWFPAGAGNQYNAAKDRYRLIPDAAYPADSRSYVFDLNPNTTNSVADNAELARAIVTWRDGVVSAGLPGHGPFKSIYDLYKVPAFRSAQAAVFGRLGTTEPGDTEGDVSPLDLASTDYDNVRYDSEEQYLMLHRVSNLITTRSDTFTVYLVVQGWRLDASAPNNPQLVTQRRAAMIVDRSKYTPTNPSPTIYNVPTQK